MDALVTGDAVVLDLRRAEPASRALAFGLDLVVLVVAFLGLGALLTRVVVETDDAIAAAVGIVLAVLVFVVVPITVETLTRGRSLGKAALGLRVVRTDGGPIRFRQALARGLSGFVIDFGVFSLFTGAIGLISALVSPIGQRVGDRLAGTVVIRERGRVSHAPVVVMPPPLAAWAAGLQLSGLPDPLALEVRRFVQRVDELDPAARARVAVDLAGRVAACVGPPPPPGTPPEPYLHAVLAERRRREEARLAGRPLRTAPPLPAATTAGDFTLPR